MEQQNTIEAQGKFGVWFDEFVATLRSHQMQLETDTASKELKAFYNSLFSGNMDAILKANKQASQEFFVKRMIVDYLEKLNKNLPKKLAFDFNDSEVLVWAEVGQDNEEMERRLILTEAAVNAQYYEYGFSMTSTIIESEDNMAVPNHYKIYQA
jgi:hypothetical protein